MDCDSAVLQCPLTPEFAMSIQQRIQRRMNHWRMVADRYGKKECSVLARAHIWSCSLFANKKSTASTLLSTSGTPAQHMPEHIATDLI